VAKSAKKNNLKEWVSLIRHSKYSAMLSKYTPDCFFGNFAHWEDPKLLQACNFFEKVTQVGELQCRSISWV